MRNIYVVIEQRPSNHDSSLHFEHNYCVCTSEKAAQRERDKRFIELGKKCNVRYEIFKFKTNDTAMLYHK